MCHVQMSSLHAMTAGAIFSSAVILCNVIDAYIDPRDCTRVVDIANRPGAFEDGAASEQRPQNLTNVTLENREKSRQTMRKL